MAAGCARLEEAAALLRDAGQPPVSPVLEAEISEALADLKPACTLEHLQVRPCARAHVLMWTMPVPDLSRRGLYRVHGEPQLPEILLSSSQGSGQRTPQPARGSACRAPQSALVSRKIYYTDLVSGDLRV